MQGLQTESRYQRQKLTLCKRGTRNVGYQVHSSYLKILEGLHPAIWLSLHLIPKD